jgi:hypothetical protein
MVRRRAQRGVSNHLRDAPTFGRLRRAYEGIAQGLRRSLTARPRGREMSGDFFTRLSLRTRPMDNVDRVRTSETLC